MTVRENVTLAHLRDFVDRDLLVDLARERAATLRLVDELQIKTPGTEQLVRNLSGGTQQKVVLAKWLLGNACVFLFDEPTRGIDVGAKTEIYKLMLELAARGAAIVMVSSDLPEVLGMSHRILVVRDGRIAAEFTRADATPDRSHRRRNRRGCMTKRDRLAYGLRIAGAAAFLVALVAVVDAASRGSFLEPSNIVRVLRQITYNCILGVGQTFVIITAGIDLSVGSLVALTGVVAALFANSAQLERLSAHRRDAARRGRRRLRGRLG